MRTNRTNSVHGPECDFGLEEPTSKPKKAVPGDSRRPEGEAPDAIHRLSELLVERGVPEYLRSDNGPEFIPDFVRK